MSASDKQDRGACCTNDQALETELDSAPRWLPDEAAIVSAETFTSPKGQQYHILRTNLTDSDDRSATEEDRVS